MPEARRCAHRGRPPVDGAARREPMRDAAIAMVCLAALAGCSRTTTSGNGRLGSDATKPTNTGSAVTRTASPSTSPSTTVSFYGVTVTNATTPNVAPGVTSNPTGPVTRLLYKDLIAGEGRPATPTSTVTVRYVGILYRDGTKFDSSWDRGQPVRFALRQALPGLAESVGGGSFVAPMRVGGRRIMILPARLGYGSRGPGLIPPNSVLVFVVDLADAS